MLIETFEAGPVATNGYVVADHPGGQALFIDAPEGAAVAMVEQARQWNTPVAFLVNTHAHWDHYWDNAAILRLTQAKFGIHAASAPLLKIPQARLFGMARDIEPSQPDFFLEEGKPLVVGDLQFEILHCPGHCPGSVVLFEARERVAFVGDVVFAGSIGRTDLPGGSRDQLLDSIGRKLLALGDDVRVWPGHGPVTTLGDERRHNPFLARDPQSGLENQWLQALRRFGRMRSKLNPIKENSYMAKKMTKSAVLSTLAAKTGVSKKQAGQFVDELVALAYKEAKNSFTIPGLGKLVLVNRAARMGRNPATGATISIPAKRVVKFRVAKAAKDAILGAK